MNGYKTGGDWMDITSLNRNEVVFEGRHKEYGAFYIRQRYPNALFLALVTSTIFAAVCIFIPYAMVHLFHREIPVVTGGGNIRVTQIDIIPNVSPPKINHPPIIPKNITGKLPPAIDNHKVDTEKNKLPDPITPYIPDGNGNSKPTGPDTIHIGNGGGGGNPPLPPPPDKPLLIVSIMPKFASGSIEDYLKKNTEYPDREKDLNIQGTVYASFVVEKDGSVSNVIIQRGIPGGPGLEAEAIRVINSMPKWIPGEDGGHPVRVQFSLPICFRIR